MLALAVLLATIFTVQGAAEASYDKPTDPIVYHRFDNTSGPVIDTTGKGRDGVNAGATRGVAGFDGNAIDTRTGPVDAGSASFYEFLGVFSIAVMVNSIALSGGDHIFSARTTGLDDFFGTENTPLRFTVDGSSFDSTIGLTAGVWHRVVVTRSAADLVNLYIDGINRGSSTKTGTFGTTTQIARIGAEIGTSGNFWNGFIDDFAIWERELSAAEVTELQKLGTVELFTGNPEPATMAIFGVGALGIFFKRRFRFHK